MRSWLGFVAAISLVVVACGDDAEESSGPLISISSGGKGGKGGGGGSESGWGGGGGSSGTSTTFPGGSGGSSTTGGTGGSKAGFGGSNTSGFGGSEAGSGGLGASGGGGNSPFGGGGEGGAGGSEAGSGGSNASGSGGSDPTGPCAGKADGPYCGEAIGAQPGTVQVCVGGNVASSQSCSDGCKNGQCLSDAVEPCFNDPDGWYCGGLIGGDPAYRYRCQGHETAEKQPCLNGCENGSCNSATSGCSGKANGHWCGENENTGKAGYLYLCQNGQVASEQACPNGCQIMPAGTDDQCKSAPVGDGYYLPFACGAKFQCTQGNNSSFSHKGKEKFAWDFAMPVGTSVRAARGGTVSHADFPSPPGSSCYNGGGSGCANLANRVVINHGDGQSTAYYHLSSLSVSKGQQVSRGQEIGKSGNSGWSTGAHLHYMVMTTCGSWYCESVPSSFVDAGVPTASNTYTSQNCP
ncbi:MAG: M23 family metallopeptidase [Myxococcales bacterium]|nr:M23 family metallopeptidase [Myxococcales bacterium]